MLKRFCFMCLLALAACGDSDDVILPGARTAILTNQALPTTDADASAEGALLGAALPNVIYSQAGTLANHQGGHLALDWPLNRVWRVSIGAGVEFGTLMAAPVADRARVFGVTPDGQLSAVDLQNGRVLWQVQIAPRLDETQGSVSGGLALDAGRVFAHAGGAELVAYNAETGSEDWRVNFDLPLLGAPVAADGRVAVTDLDGRLYVLSANDGARLWTRLGNPEATRILGGSSPALAGGALVLGGTDAELSVLNINQGTFLWGDNLSVTAPRTALDRINSIVANPVYADGLILAGSMSGRFVAFNARTGASLWEVPLATHQMPWVAGETIFAVSAKGRVYALRRRDGALRWLQDLPGAVAIDVPVSADPNRYVGPIVAGGRVVVIDQDGRGQFLDADSGEILSSHPFVGAQSAPPIVVGGMLILLNDSGSLSAYR